MYVLKQTLNKLQEARISTLNGPQHHSPNCSPPSKHWRGRLRSLSTIRHFVGPHVTTEHLYLHRSLVNHWTSSTEVRILGVCGCDAWQLRFQIL